MVKSYKLKNLGCANCAAKMEHDINKLDGVNEARITFMTSKLKLDAEDARFEEILRQAQSICTSYEQDCVIVTR